MNTRGGIVLKFPNLSQAEILAISKALADTEYGFTGSELEVLLKQYDFAKVNSPPTNTSHLNKFVPHYLRFGLPKMKYFTNRLNNKNQYICLFKSVWIQQGGL